MPNQDDIKKVVSHFNLPQQKAWIINANTTVAIIGRGGGKTHGFISPVVLRNVKGMPRGATAFISPTYMKAKGDLLPSLMNSLEKLGFYHEVDYWVGKNIPKTINHVKPFQYPQDPSYSVFWRNGHINRIIGMDRKDSGNAQSNDFIVCDEAKFLKIGEFNSRILPTNRGNEDVFADLHYHHGLMFCTDMPTNPEAKWIFEYEKLMDDEQISLIVTFDHQKQQLLKDMRELVKKEQLTDALNSRFRKGLKRLEDVLFDLRREAVYFIEASALDNIDVLGERYIRDMQRKLTPKEFRTSILNERLNGADFGFYGNFNADKHGYDDIDYSYLDMQVDIQHPEQPWRKDGDINPHQPLQIACDWGAKIVCMEVGQEFNHAFKYLNSLEVLHPERIKHLTRKFNDYYKGYPNRHVVHHYDHTAIHEDASREISYADELAQELTALGWHVEAHYIGQASKHNQRYKLFARVHAEDDATSKPERYNRTNCKYLIISIENAGVYEDHRGHQKDKRPEKLASVDPRDATHHSDAHDTLYIGVFQDRIGYADFEPDFSA